MRVDRIVDSHESGHAVPLAIELADRASRQRLVLLSTGLNRSSDLGAVMLATGFDAALMAQGGVWFDDAVKAGEPAARPWHRFPLDRLDDGIDEADLAAHSAYGAHALWPVLHGRADLIVHRAREHGAHRRVLRAMATRLASELRADDLVWIHDYGLLALGAELRRLGVTARIGFTLHAPLPSADVLIQLPRHREWLSTLLAYDLVTVATERDLAALRQYFEHELDAVLDGETIRRGARRFRARAVTPGIHPAAIAAFVGEADAADVLPRTGAAALMVGADRIDVASGLAERFQSINRLFAREPARRGEVALMQLAAPPPDRAEDSKLVRRLQRLVGAVNGRHSEPDWAPIHWLQRRYTLPALAALLRAGRVGLMTPLAEGTSLTAQAYVAAQDPADPGVLVLSQFAGAPSALAAQAIVVNPRDIGELAHAAQRALAMPVTERRARHRLALEAIRRHDLTAWREACVDALRTARDRHARPHLAQPAAAREPASPCRTQPWRATALAGAAGG